MSVKADSEPRRATATARVVRFRSNALGPEIPDQVITEEPLEIRVEAPGLPPESYATIMRTPGNDFELAVGFLASDGMITHVRDFSTVCYCTLAATEEQRYNIVTVALRGLPEGGRARTTSVSSACGVCGSQTIADIRQRVAPIESDAAISAKTITLLPERLRKRQRLFKETGAVHAAGLAEMSGDLILCREDVGRHNAVDKLLGKGLMDGAWPLQDKVLVLSGRIAFELVQKAALASIPIIAAVGAPSSLAIELARESRITLVGFVGPDHFNVYSHPERIRA